MRTLSIVLMTFLMGCQSDREIKADDLLVFAFSDGVKGGTGKIRGEGKEAPLHMLNGKSARYYEDADFFVELLRCKAKDPVLHSGKTHITYITVSLDVRERDVVGCLKRNLATHFDAGLGRQVDGRFEYGDQFSDFYEKPPNKKAL